MTGAIRCIGHRYGFVRLERSRKGHRGHEVPANERRGITEILTLFVILGFYRDPGGIGRCQKPLSTEFGVHAIVDLEEPSGERILGSDDCGRQWLYLGVIVKGGAAVLTGQHIL